MKSTDTSNKGWAVWFTGLPGSGKSRLSQIVFEMLTGDGIVCEWIELDSIRKRYVENPEYTDEERDFIYEKLVDLAEKGVKNNKNIIIDATAHKRLYRERARKRIERFIEVMVTCPLLVCIDRESKRKEGHVVAQMYRKALERKEKGTRFEDLGAVIGVDVPYEENPDAEIIIDNSTGTAMDNARKVKEAIRRYINQWA
ncbi:MAG: adenylyl-sulfate kinase [Desulfobacterales bacterium]|uniref:Adenylyl-sulfate kinase n=1 Tax=Candidatus Desulfaltia bathyphila TaxID=2841697 RepID=A0A8J6N657_9BACT|nr:adenylyl-sulfate kinase [Candidatus Desulfaltia bathyphila]MBL7195939.1 adenylyl-sulfate kinase [Desulfobacterales bacterium]MBL7207128.1 adenylyl-sulfate kinase [Desulfobacterales bacterium]